MMMNVPLTISSMMERAEKLFSKKEIVSRTHDTVTTLTYKQLGERTRRLSSALKIRIKEGERIGTLAWNHHRHVEAYFAILVLLPFCTQLIFVYLLNIFHTLFSMQKIEFYLLMKISYHSLKIFNHNYQLYKLTLL